MPAGWLAGRGAAAALVLAWCVVRAAMAGELECAEWQSRHPEWLWCDDFESDADLEKDYFDVDRAGGRFGVSTAAAFGGHSALQALYVPGAESAGGIKLSLGKTPVAPKRYTGRKFEDLYWRFYMKTGASWVGQADKVSRATIFTDANWAQASIGHVWEDTVGGLGLGLDPASGVRDDRVVTRQWNDFERLRWLGKANAQTPVYAPENRNRWFCIEARMKLNTPGRADGQFDLWIDDRHEAGREGLDWRGRYADYGINAITLENWINGGPAQLQTRYFDNLVVSTRRIGCQGPAH